MDLQSATHEERIMTKMSIECLTRSRQLGRASQVQKGVLSLPFGGTFVLN